ncbi:YbdD/YjiX family protein [Arthrobacter gengyunqii]|uniref:YbdD/YjiX family protein n=1 Tax=Arthrobacter gengyunqii TaxID=2886940 RepID=A0A9X1M3W9_9MICC|nr:YbdD/YjiX family protein [Arthrobacter gengyunqii]MCC3267471.1 YbdD/YjiX family protein [Arthrobacter gengyunqii]MCC3270953.1 YbdD/YjiX family protein [Arthrobacter gengyunqii]UOY96556.1 YbdD/YjiX family protein [Arthrobacter gengyunqii]
MTESGIRRAGALDGLRGFVRFFRDVMGEDAYRKYVSFHQGSGCSGPLLSEREFWKDKMDRQDSNPGGRCC